MAGTVVAGTGAGLNVHVLVALLIPIIGIVVDSPIGRALARRLEGPQETPPGVAELA